MPRKSLPPVVIVDDSPDELFLTRRLLMKTDVKNPVVCIEEGGQAITYLKGAMEENCAPCLVLLDINMPGIGGFDVLKWARAQARLQNTAIVMLSTSGEQRDRARAEKHGASGYLVKYPTTSQAQSVIGQFCGAGAHASRDPKATRQ
jgi:two-component system, response regulator